jgi:hypothetical protein
MPDQTQPVPTPPRVVAISGIIFSVLYIVSLALIRLAVPDDPTEPGLWLADPHIRNWVRIALNLVPFTGIAFLWFMAVLRNRIGLLEDRRDVHDRAPHDGPPSMDFVRRFWIRLGTAAGHYRLSLDRIALPLVGLACEHLYNIFGLSDLSHDSSECAIGCHCATGPEAIGWTDDRPTVLEAFAGKSLHSNEGQRIVHSCRIIRSASGIFLGWTEGQLGRQHYVRQLKDMKIKPLVEVFTPSDMLKYAELCGWTLAHAHARSGESTKISGYLGKSDKFDDAIADFSIANADQSERDHATLLEAVRVGRLEVFVEE